MPAKILKLILAAVLVLGTGLIFAEDEMISTSINDMTIDAKVSPTAEATAQVSETQISDITPETTATEAVTAEAEATQTPEIEMNAETAPAEKVQVSGEVAEEGEGIIILQPGETEPEELEKYILSKRKVSEPETQQSGEIMTDEEAAAEESSKMKFDYDEDESAKLMIMEGKEKSRIENTGYVLVERAGFISDNFTEDGKIYSKTGKDALAQGDKIYVDITVGKGFKAGTEFLIYDDSAEALDPETEGYLGRYINVCAVGKTVSNVENVKDNKYEAVIVKSYGLVRDNYKIKMRREVKEYHKKLNAKPRKKNVKIDGYIIKAAGGINAISKNDIIYINRGLDKNILPGQKFDIVRTEINPDTKEEESYHVIGTAMAVNAMKTTCVAIITSQTDLIRAGDLARTTDK